MGTALDIAIRAARDADALDLIELIAGCWAEYPGNVLDVDGELPELRRIASHFAAAGGRFWSAERRSDGRVVGSAGVVPVRQGVAELKKLYVHRSARRGGLARALLAEVEQTARRLGCLQLEAWSDTRFVEAHAFYRRTGFTETGARRELEDLSHSTEALFVKTLATDCR